MSFLLSINLSLLFAFFFLFQVFNQLDLSCCFLFSFLFFNKVKSCLFPVFRFYCFLFLCFCDLFLNLCSTPSYLVYCILCFFALLLQRVHFSLLDFTLYSTCATFLLFWLFFLFLVFKLCSNHGIKFFSSHLITLWILFDKLFVSHLPLIENFIEALITFFPCSLYQVSYF